MINRKGNLLPKHHKQLGEPNPKYDTRDIPVIVYDGLNEDSINVSDCYVGIQYRKGGFYVPEIIVKSFVNDGFIAQTGDIEIDKATIIHDLPYIYTRKNHSDPMHFQTRKPKNNIIIRDAEFHLSGKGVEDKGTFISSEIGIWSNAKLFENGFKIVRTGRFKSRTPAMNLNNSRHSVYGSPEHPLDHKKLNDAPLRILGGKPNSPVSMNNILHVYSGTKVEAKRGTVIVREYKRGWTLQERLDNWEVAKAALDLLP